MSQFLLTFYFENFRKNSLQALLIVSYSLKSFKNRIRIISSVSLFVENYKKVRKNLIKYMLKVYGITMLIKIYNKLITQV